MHIGTRRSNNSNKIINVARVLNPNKQNNIKHLIKQHKSLLILKDLFVFMRLRYFRSLLHRGPRRTERGELNRGVTSPAAGAWRREKLSPAGRLCDVTASIGAKPREGFTATVPCADWK